MQFIQQSLKNRDGPVLFFPFPLLGLGNPGQPSAVGAMKECPTIKAHREKSSEDRRHR